MPAAGVLQVHPSLRCNLRCHHCYSSSGPDQRGGLPEGLLADLVVDAAALGYGTVAVSGGEPLMFPALEVLLTTARAAGLRTMITTNGTLATPATLERLAPVLDLVAFSMDGPPDLHNEVRAVPWAFDKFVRGLRAAQDLGIPHGVLYTVTAASWPYVEWGADLAVEHGAELFQLHPIEPVGRAADEMVGHLLSGDLIEYAYAAGATVAESHGDALRVHLDLARRADIEALDAGALLGPAGQPGILVVDEEGIVVPMSHGFSRGAMVANLHEERLRDGMPAFLETRLPALVDLIGQTRQRLLHTDRRVFDLYGELGRASHHHPWPVPVTLGRAS